MSLPIQLALVPDGVPIDPSDVARVAAALAKQVQRDFAPIWNVDATVDAFTKLEDVPIDYWPMIVMRQVQGAAGFHEDKNGQPFAVIEFGSDWSLTASHECLEMLADPWGRRMRAGNVLDQAVQLGVKPGRVRYLVEVCDPSESGQFGYQVNGILVSDFYTPSFFNPVKSSGVRYSFTGAIDSPRKVLEDGYISWQEPKSRDWFQVRMFPDNISSDVPHVVNLSQDTEFEKIKQTTSLRSAVDFVTPNPPYHSGLRGPMLMAAKMGHDSSVDAQKERAADIRAAVKAVMGRGKKSKKGK